jgi:hypothetical protein
LTDIQLKFIQRIIKESGESKSYQDLSERLIRINEDIYSEVPTIQQERLFNVTAVLYYGINEIQYLEKQGQMLRTPHDDIQRVRLKSGSESGGGIGGSCSTFLATTWAIAIGEPIPAGEIVASVITIIVGGILLYEIITCSGSNSDTSDYCLERYEDCYSPIYNGCSTCLQFCNTQGYWPPYNTHQCN